MARKKKMNQDAVESTPARQTEKWVKTEQTVVAAEPVVEKEIEVHDMMPCPYCGATGKVLVKNENGHDIYTAKCSVCRDENTVKRGSSEEYVVWNWNRASIEIGLRDEVEICMKKADELLEKQLIYLEIVEKGIVYSKSANDVVARTNVEKLSRRDVKTFEDAKAEFARRVMAVVGSFRKNPMTTVDGVQMELMVCQGRDEKLRVNKLDFGGFDLPLPYVGVVVNHDTVKNCVMGFDYLKTSVHIDDRLFENAKVADDTKYVTESDAKEDDAMDKFLATACDCVSEEAKVFMKHCREGRFLSKANDRERIAIKVDDMIADMRKASDVKPGDCLRLASALICLVAATAAGDQDVMDDIQSVLDDDIHGNDDTVKQLESLWK